MEIPDAYQEYVQTRREREDVDKIATVSLPIEDMAAVWQVTAEVVDSTKQLSAEGKRRWERILSSLGRAVTEAA